MLTWEWVTLLSVLVLPAAALLGLHWTIAERRRLSQAQPLIDLEKRLAELERTSRKNELAKLQPNR
jgi:hypothetical protein